MCIEDLLLQRVSFLISIMPKFWDSTTMSSLYAVRSPLARSDARCVNRCIVYHKLVKEVKISYDMMLAGIFFLLISSFFFNPWKGIVDFLGQ